MERVTPVEDDLELAERSPEPSPESRPSPPMLPPFRHPQRPAAPPPPLLDAPIAVHTGPPRRSLGDSLPRRSLLAPEVTPPSPSGDEYARGRESDERKSEEEPESEKSKKRDRRPRKKRRSRILSELRPVDGPESALPSVPAINDDSSQASDDPLEAPDSGERAKEAFAAQRVRMRKSFRPDLRIYMKNAHPLFGICAAHRHHPYKRSDRSLVLLVALLVALLVCGLYAIRDCCSEVLNWHLSLLSGPDPGLDKFRVDFSADNGAFDTIASSVSASSSSGSSQDRNDTIFQYEWNLAENTSWMCTTCVLRICALDVNSVSSENLCIRSDGQTTSVESSRRLQATAVDGSGSSDVVTFRIVREALECSCGLAQESFLLAAVIIGVCIPVTVLLVEPLVTFYRDRQVFGLFARRDGPVRPVIAGYTFGFVAAQISTTNFLTEKGAVVVLWVVTFAIAVALGVLVYSTLVCFVIFGVRWWRERAYERREPSGLSEFQTSLLSDDEKISNDSITSPQ
ncbi:hypothetical protein PF010_g13680 [Phytophthora fragariae]|uniref:Transmembrane protein n=1 Tax=Phytophthora fragariae TaxID=53985 RepID=A0A6G0KZT9_9STRA|nr:hypothetical protein PF003_g25389 [Phytophthora fragariae]KAE9103579.1 hypothetical protein PF010_g13680 [Phytophthora fragariae]